MARILMLLALIGFCVGCGGAETTTPDQEMDAAAEESYAEDMGATGSESKEGTETESEGSDSK